MNRRTFLGATALGILASPAHAAFWKIKSAGGVTPTVGSPVVGPHPNWNGTLDSGSGKPAQTSRAAYTAKVIAGWMSVPHQRASSGYISIRVKAAGRKEGGDVTVTFKGDIPDTPVSAPAKVVIADPVSGLTHHEFVYEIKLDVAAFIARNPNVNRARIYADCVSSDPTICHRVLGIEDIPVGANIPTTGTFNATINPGETDSTGATGTATFGSYGRDWDPAYIVYPESAAGDGSPQGTGAGVFYYEFSSDGRTASYGGASLVGWANAVAAAKTALASGKSAGRLHCISTGLIEAQDVLDGDASPARGYITVTHVAGAYFGRAAVPAQVSGGASWDWKCGLMRAEWRGVTIDNAKLGRIKCSNGKPHWANAVTWIDSLGRDRLWLGQQGPGRGITGSNTIGMPCWFTDNYYENGGSPTAGGGAILELNNRSSQTAGDLHTGTKVIHSCYDDTNYNGYFTQSRSSMSITSPSGTATFQKTTNNSNYGNAYIYLTRTGQTSRTIILTELASEADRTPVDGVTFKANTWADIAAIAAPMGISITVTDTIGLQARYMNAVGPLSLTTTPTIINGFIDVHADWDQTALVENVIVANSAPVGAAANDYSGALFMGGERDHLLENVIIDATHSTGGGPGSSTGAEHAIWRYVTVMRGPGMAIGGTPGGHADTEMWNDVHSQMYGCTFNQFDVTATGTRADGPEIARNYTASGSFAGPSGSANNFTGGTIAAQFVDLTGGDYRPAGVVASTAIPVLTDCPYDMFGNLRTTANNRAGAVVDGLAVKPTLPMAA